MLIDCWPAKHPEKIQRVEYDTIGRAIGGHVHAMLAEYEGQPVLVTFHKDNMVYSVENAHVTYFLKAVFDNEASNG